MWFWITLSILQIICNIWSPLEWPSMYKRAICWFRGCACRRYYITPGMPAHAKRRIEEEQLKLDFINSVWNLYERQNHTRHFRMMIDSDKYFDGYYP